jgi:hypothetical protein
MHNELQTPLNKDIRDLSEGELKKSDGIRTEFGPVKSRGSRTWRTIAILMIVRGWGVMSDMRAEGHVAHAR